MRLPFFGRRRRLPEVARLVRIKDGDGMPRPAPLAQPRELIDVIGVGATETVNGVALTLLSVERYREGYVALFRLLRARRRGSDLPFPSLEIAVVPEGAVPYRSWSMGGSGGGWPAELEYRLSHAIVPAPTDGEIVIEARSIMWERHDREGRSVVAVDTGPWRFTVTVPS